METIGKYKVIKELGSGGFGAVYLAEDPRLGVQVAIKIFQIRDANLVSQATSASTDAAQSLRQRFINEARTLRQLSNNPHIVEMYDFDELEDGTPYYVMPYLLRSLVDEIGKDAFTAGALEDLPVDLHPRRLPVSRCVQILTQTLDALSTVHRAGLVHRDIKPANILLNDKGQVQLCDFGIAKLPDEEHSQSGVGMGSRNYMSPEQRESAKHVLASSDIYSVGILAYRMLTGTLPVGRFEDPVSYAPQLGQPLNELIISAIAQQPRQRPADATTMLQKFKEAVKSQGSTAGESQEATATFTDVSAHTQGLRDNLKPLRDRIEQLLLDNGEISASEQENLVALAAVADLDETGLQQFIKQIATDKQTQLKPIRNYLALLDRRIAEQSGTLTEQTRTSLYQAGQALGWNTDKITRVIKQRQSAAATSTSTPVTPDTTPVIPDTTPVIPAKAGIHNATTPPSPRSRGAWLWGTAAVVLVAATAWGINSYIDHQDAIIQKWVGKLVNIPSGSFQMGSNEYGVEKPIHKVAVKGFKLMEKEVTFAQWDACVQAGGCSHRPEDGDWGRGNRPVMHVSYNDITQQFIPWLEKETGQKWRLPSESEWEYAARAGSTSEYYWGDTPSGSYANGNEHFDWPNDGYKGESKFSGLTAPVGSYKPNAFGLYDMIGNVWEWTEDCWNDSYTGAPTDGSVWQSGDCAQRVLRGGSWVYSPLGLRSAFRGGDTASDRSYSVGFRLVQGR